MPTHYEEQITVSGTALLELLLARPVTYPNYALSSHGAAQYWPASDHC